jgi:hypothetical protein
MRRSGGWKKIMSNLQRLPLPVVATLPCSVFATLVSGWVHSVPIINSVAFISRTRRTNMARTWLLSGISGTSMLGLVATSVSAGFSGQGFDALKTHTPATDVTPVHSANPIGKFKRHGDCRWARKQGCHRHHTTGWTTQIHIPCPPRYCDYGKSTSNKKIIDSPQYEKLPPAPPK